MHEIVFKEENFNIVRTSFVQRGVIQPKVYTWYILHSDRHRIFKGTMARIKVGESQKKIYIEDLSYDIHAPKMYKRLPLVHAQPSWQIQLICQCLLKKGIVVHRERAFKGLKNQFDKSLLIDISFQINERWYFIEYHGVQHYFKKGVKLQRFRNILRNMEVKREWCHENQIPYLEIPFFRQNDITEILETFIADILEDDLEQKKLDV
ncbi:hypothetical protein AEQ18_13180 [Enterococcus sp. RIT-PI-f]|nr:hypothetical protein AEQ18_13180 [Enterococcus sp. RIT-PI-f]